MKRLTAALLPFTLVLLDTVPFSGGRDAYGSRSNAVRSMAAAVQYGFMRLWPIGIKSLLYITTPVRYIILSMPV